MRLRHPASFFLMIVLMVATAALSVAWSLAHMVALLFVLALMPLLRWTAHYEGRRSPT
jgi:hypothetical protein